MEMSWKILYNKCKVKIKNDRKSADKKAIKKLKKLKIYKMLKEEFNINLK